MFEKVSVKGKDHHPLYRLLTDQEGQVTWNFNKFLVGRDGQIRKRFDSAVEPLSAELRAAIDRELKTSGWRLQLVERKKAALGRPFFLG